jgi:hypothetical protein
MSGTYRTTYDGEQVRDGQWCRRCHSGNCPRCIIGTEKRPWKRRERHRVRRQLDKYIPR